MIENREECVVKFDKIVELIHKKGHLSAKEGDNAKYQFNDFVDNISLNNLSCSLGLTGERIVLTIFMVNG